MSATAIQADPKPATRLHHLDNLRVYLTFLVVAHHVALVYSNLPFWPNWDEPSNAAAALPLDLFMLLNQSYMMGFFFLVSGYFTPGSLDRRGPGPYAAERLQRLAIPFAAFVVLLRPIYTLPNYLEMSASERPPYWEYYFTATDIGPAWFIEVLLVFSLLYAWFRWRGPAVPEPVEPRRLRAWHVAAFALALGAVTWVWRMAVPNGMYMPIVGLPSASYMPQYVGMFVVGIAAYRRGWFQEPPKRAGLLGAALVAGSAVPMALGGYEALDLESPPPVGDLSHLSLAMWDSLFAVGSIVLLLRLFRRFAAGTGPFARFLSANAYAVYLVHAPVLIGVAAVLHPVAMTPVLKFLIALALAASLSWGLAAAVRRLPAARKVL